MSLSLPRAIRSVYRKEPISSFVLTMGAVDAAIGGFDNRWSLLAVGVGTVSLAIVYRWWLFRRQRAEQQVEQGPVRMLPPHSSNTQLPLLSMSKKRPPV